MEQSARRRFLAVWPLPSRFRGSPWSPAIFTTLRFRSSAELSSSFVGVTDDVLSLKPTTKLIAEIALAAMFVFFGERLHWTDVLAVDMLLTMFWLVGLTNAFNLLDNMDGLCAGIAIIAGAALLVGLVGRPSR